MILPSPLHPALVHFPIALIFFALVMEAVSLVVKKESFHRAALYAFIFAALFSPLVIKTGEMEVHRLNLHHPLVEQHEELGELLMWFLLASLPALFLTGKKLKKYFRLVFFSVLIVSAVLVVMTAEKGGKMVYEYGVGVEN